MTGALRSEKRDHHDDTREEKQRSRCGDRLFETRHREGGGRSAGTGRFKDVSAVERRDRHTDEVHKVISREGKSESESAREDDDLENIEIENKNRKDNLDYKTINIHNIYDVLKSKKRICDNSFIKSTIKYLESNARFNLFVNAMIYLVLGFMELCRYGVIIYSIYLVGLGEMEIGTVLLIYSYYSKIITNFEVLGTINAEYQSVKVSVNRLNKIRSNKEIYED